MYLCFSYSSFLWNRLATKFSCTKRTVHKVIVIVLLIKILIKKCKVIHLNWVLIFSVIFFQESGNSRSGDQLELNRSTSQESTISTIKEKKYGDKKSSERPKKKSAWYNVLYPTYKSRSEDFKRLFKDVPDDERLIVGEFLMM